MGRFYLERLDRGLILTYRQDKSLVELFVIKYLVRVADIKVWL